MTACGATRSVLKLQGIVSECEVCMRSRITSGCFLIV